MDNAPAQEQQASEMKLESALSAQFDEMESEETGEELESQAEVPEESDEEEVEEASGEDGPEAEEEVAEEEQTHEEQLADEVQEAAESDFNEPAPERWPDEIKQVYNDLPPTARKAMLEGIFKPMQRQYTEATQNLSQMRGTVEPVLQSLNQYRNDFERMGANPIEEVQKQIAWAAHFARVGPEQGLRDMQAAYGFDQQPAGQQEEQYLTPIERDMKAKLDALESQVGQSQQQREQERLQAQNNLIEQRKNEVNRGLSDFINEQKDGKPAHPHIEKVAPAIAGLIRGGLVRTADEYGNPVPPRDQIAQAYQMACDLDPSIRTVSRTSQNGQIERARAAGNVGIVAKTPASEVDVPPTSIEDDLSSTFDKLQSRTR